MIAALGCLLGGSACGSTAASGGQGFSYPTAPETVSVPQSIRAPITHTLDAFVVAAVERHDLARAYNLVTPTLRGGMSHRAWMTGRIPVQPYPGRETHVGEKGWTPMYVQGDSVGLHLILHPRKNAKVGPAAFTVVVRRTGQRWLVDDFYLEAGYADSTSADTIVATPDFGPHQQGVALRKKPSTGIALIPFFVLGLPVLLVVGALSVIGVRGYRGRRPLGPDDRAAVPWRRGDGD